MVTLKEYRELRYNEILDYKDKEVAIYGTGVGAQQLLEYLEKIGAINRVRCLIDRDDSELINEYKYGYPVSKLADVISDVKIIVIGALSSRDIIEDRLNKYISENNIDVTILNPFTHKNTTESKLEFLDFIEGKAINKQEEFVDIVSDNYERNECDTKLIAWYLPQFYEMEINNVNHGRGFTEWTNSSKAMPQYVGHYQPHIPYDVGYYTLNNDKIIKKQVDLAKKYGIYGFGFYYYWFSGKRIMEKPLEIFLNNKDIDFPFCIMWANENWSRKWNGSTEELIFEQRLEEGDEYKFINDIMPILKDERYIRIDNKPVLIFYRSNIYTKEQFKNLIRICKEEAQKNGLPGLYIMITNAFSFYDSVESWGADALVEFPPHGIAKLSTRVVPEGYMNPHFEAKMYDMKKMIDEKAFLYEHLSKEVYRGVMLSFDSTPRKALFGAVVYYGIDPQYYEKWLYEVMMENKKKLPDDKNFVFVNSWNEWAEGTHLEPDLRYGYAYLQATLNAIYRTRN